ncbi:MAG: hypothetical protein Q9M26_08620 [Mariprofundales bacterium]|nr:hypothetical protein [Mariprofundales bacterium]
MVKKALNNPIVVGVLALLAIAFVFRDFIHLSGTTTHSVPVPLPPVVAQPGVVKSSRLVGKSVAVAQPVVAAKRGVTEWSLVASTPLTARDPFIKFDRALEKGAAIVASVPHRSIAEPASQMTLSAIVSQPAGRYASIDGNLVHVGDHVGKWRVVAMRDDRVQLRSERGLLTLGMDGSVKFGGKALLAEESRTEKVRAVFKGR